MCRGVLFGELTSTGPGDFVYNADKKYVACPWHGWEFDVATGQSYFDPARTRVRTYAVEVQKAAAETGAETGAGHGVEGATPEEYVRMVQDDFRLREETEAGAQPGGRQPGPYSVEPISVAVQDGYLVVDLTPPRPVRERTPR
jgi:3-phenylpropionate/trans-cinnamate dioxygenase ferredoxin subunit